MNVHRVAIPLRHPCLPAFAVHIFLMIYCIDIRENVYCNLLLFWIIYNTLNIRNVLVLAVISYFCIAGLIIAVQVTL